MNVGDKENGLLCWPALTTVVLTVLLSGCGNQTTPNGMQVLDAGADGVTFSLQDIHHGDTAEDAATEDAGSADSSLQDGGQACTSVCSEGAKQCGEVGGAKGVQACVDIDDDGCFEWGAPNACDAGKACKSGVCVASCPKQDCTIAGAHRCSDKGLVQTCGDFNSDGCLAWGGGAPCAGGTVCDQGQCAKSCSNACTQKGATKCEGGVVKTCGDSDGNSCLDWGKSTKCEGKLVCANGACASSCTPTCTVKGATQCDGNGVATCGDHNGDGCLGWGTPVTCSQGKTCSGGSCVDTCKSTCTAVGAKQCQLNAVQICGDFNKDGCLEWGTAVPCKSGDACSAGSCAATCKDQCTTQGAKQCDPAGGVQTCDDYNKDGCKEWGTPTACGANLTCSGGSCVKTCANQCQANGAKQCVPGGTAQVQTCGDYNKDGCLEWGTAVSCPTKQACSKGACVQTCQSSCPKKGAKQCGSLGAKGGVQICDDYNKDSCLEWGTEAPCKAWQQCQTGVCSDAPAPAGVVLNEVTYDSAGPDSQTFVELRGKPGTQLAGFSLVGINGKGGAKYAEVALVGAIGSDGLFVVAHSGATGALKVAADQLAAGVDFQNGPDNVALRWGAKTVDALGYGVFSGSLVFKGEGKPAADVAAGHSLARDDLGTDTDNNVKDFYDQTSPTPGKANPKPCVPTTCAAEKAACGTIGDGCGTVLTCGTCPQDKVCGATKVCGDKPCEPKTCSQLSVQCGSVSDGCSKTLSCGPCKSDQSCKAGKCVCKPKTCGDLAKQCGAAADGCGGSLACGTCTGGKVCASGVCVCKPTTCAALGVSCGTPGDGCGGKLDCNSAANGGGCKSGQVCSSQGKCVCKPKTCSDLGLTCGTADNGCGAKLDCGACTATPCGNGTCPSGYKCGENLTCEGGNPLNLMFDYKTITVGGSVTVNGKPMELTQYCKTTTSSLYMNVQFEETTWGYKYTYERRCNKQGQLQSLAHFTRSIFPGTYKVSVYAYNSYAKVPVSGTQVIYPSLKLDKDTPDLKLDYKTVQVAGKVTVNGQPMALTQYCKTTTSSLYMNVQFVETTWGYKYTYERRCNKQGQLQSLAHFARSIFPGTYKVSVYAYNSYAKVPVSGTQVIYPTLEITGDKLAIDLDYKTVAVDGKVTVNGKPMALTQYCKTTTSSLYMNVQFVETTWGYKYTYERRCNKQGQLPSLAHFARSIFPGTYKVSVYAYNSYAKVPVSGTQVIHANLPLMANKSGLNLDYKTVSVDGHVTVNGQPMTLTQYCKTTTSSLYMNVQFVETTWGYKYTYERRCNKQGQLQSLAHFARHIFPGTYKVSVYAYNSYAKVPVSGTQVILPKLALTADKTGLKLDYKTIAVDGWVTVNGQPMTLTQYCKTTTSSLYMNVQFVETTWGYKYTYERRCNKQAQLQSLAHFARHIFPGTYKVSVYAYNSYVKVPVSGTQVIYPKLALGADTKAIKLDYKTLAVAGVVTVNGQSMALTQYCKTTTSSLYMNVQFVETTWGYKYTYERRCNKQAQLQSLAHFTRSIFPGTYKVSVYAYNSYVKVPVSGTQVVVPRLKLQ
ncbi:MAG: hypothetical protein KC502_14480 [Myxococcales bacterium]|nr:hypothetical protein [Myxococcales bacterium]